MVGMGLAALGPEKYIGRCPGHKQVLRSGNSRYTGRADYDLRAQGNHLQGNARKCQLNYYRDDPIIGNAV